MAAGGHSCGGTRMELSGRCIEAMCGRRTLRARETPDHTGTEVG